MKFVKQDKGITLVALTITIIVLIILLSVTINAVIGDQSVTKKSRNERDTTRAKMIKEAMVNYNLELELGQTEDNITEYLKNKDMITQEEKQEIENTHKLVLGKETILFGKRLVDAFNEGEIKVGDYINYNEHIDETKTVETKTETNGWSNQNYIASKSTTWRVLGLDKTSKRLILISGNPIKKQMNSSSKNTWEKTPYLYMKGAYAYKNSKDILDNICSIYSTKYGTAKSITAEEINRLLNVTVDEENKKVYANTTTGTNIDEMGNLGNIYTYKNSDYSIESYINNKTHSLEGQKVNSNAYYYLYGGLSIDNTLKEILFNGTSKDDKYSKSYWLACRGTNIENGALNAKYGVGAVSYGGVYNNTEEFTTDGTWKAIGFAVRPVVYVNAGVTVDDLKVITSTEESWSGYDNSTPIIATGDASNGEAGTI